MTVKPVNKINQNQNQDLDMMVSSMEVVDLYRRVGGKKNVFPASDEEADESSGSSAEEAESPKSVARIARKKVVEQFMHNQILRVKEEEMMFYTEDIGKRSLSKETPETDRYTKREVDVVVFSRQTLPCSPLSGKTESSARTALH
ncbi:hypothetical protein Ddye_008037 [Dipteronia dyeriana]|uniref:Uncharacterized protein n=1 Tax=Dipteronia dyeriana TaxID=168575 RepID=A0AAE0CKX6_9ROSI|nr:hypothetical protein Ddye_008037 [Dipteronia dyeriana]